jgi:hypothetical protein
MLAVGLDRVKTIISLKNPGTFRNVKNHFLYPMLLHYHDNDDQKDDIVPVVASAAVESKEVVTSAAAAGAGGESKEEKKKSSSGAAAAPTKGGPTPAAATDIFALHKVRFARLRELALRDMIPNGLFVSDWKNKFARRWNDNRNAALRLAHEQKEQGKVEACLSWVPAPVTWVLALDLFPHAQSWVYTAGVKGPSYNLGFEWLMADANDAEVRAFMHAFVDPPSVLKVAQMQKEFYKRSVPNEWKVFTETYMSVVASTTEKKKDDVVCAIALKILSEKKKISHDDRHEFFSTLEKHLDAARVRYPLISSLSLFHIVMDSLWLCA